MRRMIVALGIGLMATALTAGVAQAAPATEGRTGTATHTAMASARARHWYAVAGERQTEASAKELMRQLAAKGFEGFQTRMRYVREGLHRVRRFEVERMFPNSQAARVEVKRLREARFPGRVARERG